MDDDATSPPWAIDHAVAVGVTLLVLETHSRLPELSFLVLVVSGAVILALGFSYVWRLIHISMGRIRASAETPSESVNFQPIQSPAESSDDADNGSMVVKKGRGLLNWLVLPACLFIMFTSAATHWPAVIRFHFSRASFEELVAQSHSGKVLKGFPRRVGLYWIEDVEFFERNEKTGRRSIGFVTGVVLLDPCGLEYDEVNLSSSHYLTTRIAPCWYLTEW